MSMIRVPLATPRSLALLHPRVTPGLHAAHLGFPAARRDAVMTLATAPNQPGSSGGGEADPWVWIRRGSSPSPSPSASPSNAAAASSSSSSSSVLPLVRAKKRWARRQRFLKQEPSASAVSLTSPPGGGAPAAHAGAAPAAASATSTSDVSSSSSSSADVRSHRASADSSAAQRAACPAEADQMVALNVGGSVMHTSRSTLTCLPGSLLAQLFGTPEAEATSGSSGSSRSGSGGQQRLMRDAQGRVFLDYDPACFALVLRYLRDVKMAMAAAPGGPLPPLPQAGPRSAASFRQLAAHLRLLPPGRARPPVAAAGGTSSSPARQQPAAEPTQPPQALLLPRPAGGAPSGGRSASPAGAGAARARRAASLPSSGTPAVSQLYYIQAQWEPRRGTRISVYTEGDLASLPAREAFDVFADTTYSDTCLALTFVCRKDFDDVFLGITSRSQLDRKGCSIPCYGWKSRRYGEESSECSANAVVPGGLVELEPPSGLGGKQPRAVGLASQSEGTSAAAASAAAAGAAAAAAASAAGGEPLWRKGDSVELMMDLLAGNRLSLRVNGQEVDSINRLPSFKGWCWYLALYTGNDMSCVVFNKDSYSVFWQDYMVKRWL